MEFDAGTGLIAAACKTWTVSRAPRAPRKRLLQPTLVVSGALDPAMPPSVATRALRDLPRGTHLVLPATAHGPMFPGCATDVVKAFIAAAGATTSDTRCVDALKLPPWKTS
jgi:pimeloyl-ACP methyl ester carboxylesterase